MQREKRHDECTQHAHYMHIDRRLCNIVILHVQTFKQKQSNPHSFRSIIPQPLVVHMYVVAFILYFLSNTTNFIVHFIPENLASKKDIRFRYMYI